MTRRPDRRLVFGAEVVRQAFEEASAALPLETGGVLLGFRDAEGIVVTRLLTVRDEASSGVSYVRSREHAQKALEIELELAPSHVGYVGEWHSHPAPSEPSGIDERSLRATVLSGRAPIALLVVATAADGTWSVHARLAEGVPRMFRAKSVRVVVPTVLVDERPVSQLEDAGRQSNNDA